MRKPIFVRPLSDDERKALEEGLHSSDAFVLRRCQVLLASDRGERASRIARALGCNDQTVRNAIHTFDEGGLEKALEKGSSRPRTIHAAFGPQRAERLREMLHRSPREFGKPTSLCVDPGVCCGGEPRGGLDRGAGNGRDRPGYPGEAGGALDAGQSVDQ